jgi:plastocyanin
VGRLRGFGVGLIVLAFAVTGCSSNNNDANTGSGGDGGAVATSPGSGGSGGGGSNGGGGGGASTASITIQNFAFSPDSVDVSAGTAKVTVTNEDTTEHTFTLDDGSSSTNLDPGKTETVTLDLSKTVGFHCNIHPTMTGTLTVS